MGPELFRKVDHAVLANIGIVEASMIVTIDRVKQSLQNGYLGDAAQIQDAVLFLMDSDRLAFSEMPICHFLNSSPASSILTPLGFEVTQGFVASTLTGRDPATHFFLINRSADAVACFTPGQFIDSTTLPLRRGVKLEALAKRAPSLVTRVSDDVTLLRGPRTEIFDRLGLIYVTNAELGLPATNLTYTI